MNTSHYPSLGLCNKLTEAGFPTTELWIQWNCWNWSHKYYRNKRTDFVCPSVMELLDEMPDYIIDDRYTLSINYMLMWEIWYTPIYGEDKLLKHFEWDILVNALAEMWLWLKENNYLTK